MNTPSPFAHYLPLLSLSLSLSLSICTAPSSLPLFFFAMSAPAFYWDGGDDTPKAAPKIVSKPAPKPAAAAAVATRPDEEMKDASHRDKRQRTAAASPPAAAANAAAAMPPPVKYTRPANPPAAAASSDVAAASGAITPIHDRHSFATDEPKIASYFDSASLAAAGVPDYATHYSAESLKCALKGAMEVEKKLINSATTHGQRIQITNQAIQHTETLIQQHLDRVDKWLYGRDQQRQEWINVRDKQLRNEAKQAAEAMEENHKEECKRLTEESRRLLYEIMEANHKAEAMQQKHKKECDRLSSEAKEHAEVQQKAMHELAVKTEQAKDAIAKLQTCTICKGQSLSPLLSHHCYLIHANSLILSHHCLQLLDRPRTQVFVDCGHFGSCKQCAEHAVTCPNCPAVTAKKKHREVFCSSQ